MMSVLLEIWKKVRDRRCVCTVLKRENKVKIYEKDS